MTGVSPMGSRGSPPASGSTTPTMAAPTPMIMTLPSSSLPHQSPSLTMWCPLVSPPPPPTMMMLPPKSPAGEELKATKTTTLIFYRRYMMFCIKLFVNLFNHCQLGDIEHNDKLCMSSQRAKHHFQHDVCCRTRKGLMPGKVLLTYC